MQTTHLTATPHRTSDHLSTPRLLLHAEGIAVLVSAIATYANQSWGWGLFFALLLVPDLVFIAYAAGKKIGSRAYNLMHFYALPLALGVLGLLFDASTAQQIAVIWFAHIGMDRALGYGFKYVTGFKDTHISRV